VGFFDNIFDNITNAFENVFIDPFQEIGEAFGADLYGKRGDGGGPDTPEMPQPADAMEAALDDQRRRLIDLRRASTILTGSRGEETKDLLGQLGILG
jgi:hypothetical protein